MRTERGRLRYHCRNKAQGLGCSGSGSFLDVYQDQLVTDLTAFEMPGDWKQHLLALATQHADDGQGREQQRRRLQERLARLKELYAWGDLTREQYQEQRDAVEKEMTQLQPVEQQEDRLEQYARYISDLPSAWADADQAHRNQLARILYEEVWVNGPRVEYVTPQPEMEPLSQVRAGAAQPTMGSGNETAPHGEGLSQPMMAGATPTGYDSAISARSCSGEAVVMSIFRAMPNASA